MSTILLIICIFATSGQNIFKKQYNSKVQNGVFCFNAISSFFALLFFAVPALVKGFEFHIGLIGYSLAYAICYVVTLVCIYLAILWGGFGMTSLIYSYSTVIPTLFAILFLGEKMNLLIGVGFVALVISLFLTNTDRSVADRVTVKWVVVLLLAFLSNGMCAVTQNLQQIAFDGAYKNEFMVLALVIVEIVFWTLVFWKDRPFLKESFQKGLVPAAACGICNGATNLLVMFLLGMMASSILFPAISAGGIIISFVFSVLVYREPFGLRQGIGVTFGIVAMVLLNL